MAQIKDPEGNFINSEAIEFLNNTYDDITKPEMQVVTVVSSSPNNFPHHQQFVNINVRLPFTGDAASMTNVLATSSNIVNNTITHNMNESVIFGSKYGRKKRASTRIINRCLTRADFLWKDLLNLTVSATPHNTCML
jgi:hypothetical protein